MSRRCKNVYKRKDGRYEGRYIRGRDINGRAQYGSVYARSYAEVKEKLEKANQEHGDKAPSTLTLSNWIEMQLDEISARVKESTYIIYRRHYVCHIKPFFGDVHLNKLNKNILQSFVDSLNYLALPTIKSIFGFLKSCLKKAKKCGYIPDIWEDISFPTVKQRAPMRVFSRKEQAQLEEAVLHGGMSDGIGIIICLYTGLRIGELCALRWSDIDFNLSFISVRRTIQRLSDGDGKEKTKIVFMPPKSVNSIRDIPIPEFLIKNLAELKKHSSGEYVLGLSDTPIEPRCYQYRFSKLLREINISPAKFHTTRHTFAARALETGMDIKTLSEILGHSNASITLKKYAHSSAEQKRISIQNLAQEIFSNSVCGQNNGQS